MINIDEQKFNKIVSSVIDSLPENFIEKINNLAIFVEDYPTQEQLKKLGLTGKHGLYGLYEGYIQSRKINVGAVLPDRITLFRKNILSQASNITDAEERIKKTLVHEIAHHFGSNESGARKASSNKKTT